MPNSLIDQFNTTFQDLKGIVHSAGSWEEAARQAGEICEAAEAERVAIARAPGPFQEALGRWCEESGERVMSLTAFGSAIRERGFEKDGRSGRVRYLGLTTKGARE